MDWDTINSYLQRLPGAPFLNAQLAAAQKSSDAGQPARAAGNVAAGVVGSPFAALLDMLSAANYPLKRVSEGANAGLSIARGNAADFLGGFAGGAPAEPRDVWDIPTSPYSDKTADATDSSATAAAKRASTSAPVSSPPGVRIGPVTNLGPVDAGSAPEAKSYPMPDRPDGASDWRTMYSDAMSSLGGMPRLQDTRPDDRSIARDVIIPAALAMMANAGDGRNFVSGMAAAGAAGSAGYNKARDVAYTDALREYQDQEQNLRHMADLGIAQNKFSSEQGMKAYEEGIKARGQDMMGDYYQGMLEQGRQRLAQSNRQIVHGPQGSAFILDMNTGQKQMVVPPSPAAASESPVQKELKILREVNALGPEDKALWDEAHKPDMSKVILEAAKLAGSSATSPQEVGPLFNQFKSMMTGQTAQKIPVGTAVTQKDGTYSVPGGPTYVVKNGKVDSVR